MTKKAKQYTVQEKTNGLIYKIYSKNLFSMLLKRTFLQFCFILFFFSFSCTAITQAQEEKIYELLREQWKRVNYVQPPGFETIFNELEPSLWPSLPESYEWRIEKDNTINLYKHKETPDRNVEFVTYFTNSLAQFNFLSRWDETTHHSFAYTRKGLTSNNPLRDVYPMSADTFWTQDQDYMRGHCIDFLDTQGISENSQGSGIIVIKNISTLDPRNYIPEPTKPTPYWGETIRREFVGQIRQRNETYAQYAYYSFFPNKTIKRIAIPKGIYFVRSSAPSQNTFVSQISTNLSSGLDYEV